MKKWQALKLGILKGMHFGLTVGVFAGGCRAGYDRLLEEHDFLAFGIFAGATILAAGVLVEGYRMITEIETEWNKDDDPGYHKVRSK